MKQDHEYEGDQKSNQESNQEGTQEQDERIGQMMKQYASGIEGRMVAPAAGRVWRKAEAYRKDMALRRAMRGLRVMRVLGGVYAIAMLAWCLKSYLQTPAGRAVMAMDSVMRGEIVPAVSILMVVMAAGAWFLLREGRRDVLST